VDNHGDGTTVQCATCPTVLTADTLTVDRWPLAGADGGRYVRDNIRAQCSPCASAQGGRMGPARVGADLWKLALPVSMRPPPTP
jgi:hypothetical protein